MIDDRHPLYLLALAQLSLPRDPRKEAERLAAAQAESDRKPAPVPQERLVAC